MDKKEIVIALFQKDIYVSSRKYWSVYKLGKIKTNDIFDFTIRSNNFTVKYSTVPKNADEYFNIWNLLKNGKADLLLERQIADFDEISGCSMTNSFETAFTSVVSFEGATYMEPLYTVYFSLSYKCYFGIFISLILLAVTINVFEARAHYEQLTIKNCVEHVWRNFGNLLLKSRPTLPYSFRGKFLFMTLMVEIFVVMAFYNGNFQAGYTTLSGQVINHFEDLIGKPFNIIFANHSGSLPFFLNLCEKEPAYKGLRDKIKLMNDELYVKEFMDGSLGNLVVNGDCVIIDAVENLHILLEYSKMPKKLRIGSMRVLPLSIVFYIRKNISFIIKDTINTRINRFVETEQRTPYDRNLALKLKRSVVPNEDTPPDPLNLDELFPVFLMHCVGNLISMVCVLSETCFCSKKREI